ncbi:FAD-dependent oxidoreductase [Microbacterium sp. zg.B48]|uniref:protoporphyrinogen/coproporphyrinogen oxidase n=1 Tax=unclassified Microbacterium TaxID=2609290 RepID=UPI00214BA178|nr:MULTISPECIES: FAD-dependent oxidoreductase [unclassified Microbacterium]MCR2765041.1 FAD-dependent oxidoreductase [Microbacterium sp. zg.B48]MCR2811219.1 FAD-dependent oxidoreductase [Microbacterium sp. zg.B185]WIM19818.1 FAD-dependent oxidoreductase [Microbacterium sp. zg-B185]
MSQSPLQPVSPRVRSTARSSPVRVLVLGAGVAGLVLARDLARAGVPVTVFDPAARVGGQLADIVLAGVRLDAAAESFATRGGAVAELASELGLDDDLVLPRESPAWLIGRHGAAHPLPAASVLGVPADPRAAAVLDALGRWGSWRARWDSIVPLRRPEAYRSFGDLVRRRMGPRVVRGLVGPVVRGVYSTVPDALSLAQASPGLPEALRASRSLGAAVTRLRAASPAGSQVGGLRGGVHRLAAALEQDARAAGAQFVLNARIRSVDASGVRLDGGEHLPGRVVLASAAAAGPAVRTRSITLATAVVDAADLDAGPRGTGALVEAGASGVTARALTHSSAKWQWLADQLPAHRHVVRLSYDEMPDDAEATVSADLRAITGARIERLLELNVHTWTRTLEAAPSPHGVETVGEAASLTGLASIVPAARAAAERITADVSAAPQGGAEG